MKANLVRMIDSGLHLYRLASLSDCRLNIINTQLYLIFGLIVKINQKVLYYIKRQRENIYEIVCIIYIQNYTEVVDKFHF